MDKIIYKSIVDTMKNDLPRELDPSKMAREWMAFKAFVRFKNQKQEFEEFFAEFAEIIHEIQISEAIDREG